MVTYSGLNPTESAPATKDLLQLYIMSLAAVFFQFPVILLIMLQVDLIIVKWHHPLACHDFLMTDSIVQVLLLCFVYLHLVSLTEVSRDVK